MNLIRNKREEFSLSIRRDRREEIFKQKRLTTKEQILPFSIQNNEQSVLYFNAFYYKQIPQQFYDENIWKIIKIAEIIELFQNQDCDNYYDTSIDVDLCFELLNQNYPILNRACLQILLTITLSNHQACKPILQHLPELINFFLQTQYEELRSSTLIIVSNLAADCYQCRDSVLIYECPQKMFQHLKKEPKIQEMEDFAQILINISRMKPFLSNYNQIQMYKICLQLFEYLQEKETKAGILQFIVKIYQHDKNHLDVNFIHKLCQNNKNNKECQNEILSLIKILSLFDRPKYEHVEQDILNFLIELVNQLNQKISLTLSEQKQINKLLNIFTNLLLENPQIIQQIFSSSLNKLFQNCYDNCEKFEEIYFNSPFYSFYLEIINCFSTTQLEQFVIIFKPIQHLIYLADFDISEEAQILLLKIIESLLKKNQNCRQNFIDNNGERILARLSQQENDELFDICERIFDLI